MSETGPGSRKGRFELETSAEQSYFRAVEETFIRLRGAPLLLSPSDHRIAREWFDAGIPLRVVTEALEELFEARRERGASKRVPNLRFCKPAVEKAWKVASELRASDRRAEAKPVDLRDRLRGLAAALPEGLQAHWTEKLEALASLPEAEVEARLETLDEQLLDEARSRLSQAEAAELASAVEASLSAVAGRLTQAQLDESRGRLERQLLRKRAGLPLLTLFG